MNNKMKNRLIFIKTLSKMQVFCIIFAIFLSLYFCNGHLLFDNNNDGFAFFTITSSKNKDITSAQSMVTMESNTGRILYKKNENKKLPMASTTKIITAIVAIENCKDIDKKELVPENAVGIEGSSIYLRKNEHLSIRELLYGLMLRSGNDE